ncbi:TPA: hypothetical protein ACSIX0_003993, partial [Acinetobacter baumannii]
MPFRSLERGWRRGATRSSYRGRDQAGATDVILDIKRLLLSPGNTSILPENIVGQSLSVGFRPLPQTTPGGKGMKKPNQDDEPFFITEEIAAEMIAGGYEFELPPIPCTIRLRDVLERMTDAELALQPGEIADQER